MSVPKLVWTLQILIAGQWRLVPGSWPTRAEAEEAFLNMMPGFNRRDQVPTDHKTVARII